MLVAAAVAAVFVGELLLIRRSHFLQKAAEHEYFAKLQPVLPIHSSPAWNKGFLDQEARFRAANAKKTQEYRRAARFPWLPEPK